MKENVQCCVAGSFEKSKKEIDEAIDNFRNLNVTVLSPAKGWLFLPRDSHIRRYGAGFRPLPSERGMGIKQIEDKHLGCIKRSDFLYVINLNGYVGASTFMEIGFSLAHGIPVYSREPLSLDVDFDLEIREILATEIKVATPEEAVKDFKEKQYELVDKQNGIIELGTFQKH